MLMLTDEEYHVLHNLDITQHALQPLLQTRRRPRHSSARHKRMRQRMARMGGSCSAVRAWRAASMQKAHLKLASVLCARNETGQVETQHASVLRNSTAQHSTARTAQHSTAPHTECGARERALRAGPGRCRESGGRETVTEQTATGRVLTDLDRIRHFAVHDSLSQTCAGTHLHKRDGTASEG